MSSKPDTQTTRLWPDPPELCNAPPQFRLGYRQAQDDAAREIGLLRAVVRDVREALAGQGDACDLIANARVFLEWIG